MAWLGGSVRNRGIGALRWTPVLAALLVALQAAVLPAQYEPRLQYQNRGDRHEGLRPGLVSGYDIELVSALVDDREKVRGWPEKLRLRFYLHEGGEAHIIVRELDYRAYYWLDRVRASWRAGVFNEYAWETKTVLRQTDLGMYDLGAVVRLGKDHPGKEERVLPALLYHSERPEAVARYRFTFKTNGNAQVKAEIFRGETRLFLRPQNRETAGRPFAVRFPAGDAPEGWYRLELSGYFESDGGRLRQTVHFYHRPRWR